jgi:hypothetical protein
MGQMGRLFVPFAFAPPPAGAFSGIPWLGRPKSFALALSFALAEGDFGFFFSRQQPWLLVIGPLVQLVFLLACDVFSPGLLQILPGTSHQCYLLC